MKALGQVCWGATGRKTAACSIARGERLCLQELDEREVAPAAKWTDSASALPMATAIVFVTEADRLQVAEAVASATVTTGQALAELVRLGKERCCPMYSVAPRCFRYRWSQHFRLILLRVDHRLSGRPLMHAASVATYI